MARVPSTRSEPETLTHAQVQAQAQSGAVRLTDYDPLQAGLNLLIEAGESRDGDFTMDDLDKAALTVPDAERATTRMNAKLERCK